MAANELLQHALVIVIGHYGSGKTNLSLNLARMLKAQGKQPTLVDLDVVNPYFRSTDYQELTEHEDIPIVGPVFGKSNLDAPSLPPAVDTTIQQAHIDAPVIVDVGGDPDGARALARYVPSIERVDDALVVVVVNTRRPETKSLEDNLAMIKQLEKQTGLTVSGMVGNNHLAESTTLELALEAESLLKTLAKQSKRKLLAITVPAEAIEDPSATDKTHERLSPSQTATNGGSPVDEKGARVVEFDDALLLPVTRLVKTVWQ